MFSFSVQNSYGERMELTHNPAYNVVSLDGIDPPDAVINTTRNAGSDGSVFNSSYIDNRIITITLSVNHPAESNRIALYKYFKVKRPARLFYTNGERDVYIDGYVQTMQVGYFDKKESVQITVVCPSPLWRAMENGTTEFSYIVPDFSFPWSREEDDTEEIVFSHVEQELEKSVYNNSDVEVGAVISLHATGAVENPVLTNATTGESFTVNVTMASGDTLIINTKEEKGVILTHEGVTTSVIGYMATGSAWFQLRTGDNVFVVDATAGKLNLLVSFDVPTMFEGV